MKVRTMVKKDVNDIYSFWQESGLFVRSVQREKEEVELLIKHNPDTCFIIEKGKKIIGSIFGAFNGRRAWIYHLCIHPQYQKKGYGSLLLKKTEDELRKKGATKILLGVFLTSLKIVPFYKKSGYTVMNDMITFEKDLWKEKKI